MEVVMRVFEHVFRTAQESLPEEQQTYPLTIAHDAVVLQ